MNKKINIGVEELEEKELRDPKVHNYGVDMGIYSDEDYKMISDKYSMFEVSGGYSFGDGISDLQLEFPTKAQAIEAHDFIEQYVDDDKDEYVSWYALNIHGIQVEDKEESVNMIRQEHILETVSTRKDLEIVLDCIESVIECSDGVPLDQPAHHNAKYTMGELIQVYEMIKEHIQLVPVKPEVTLSHQEAIERAKQGTLPTCPHLEKIKIFKACYADCIVQYIFGTECNLSDDWKVVDLGYLSYVNMTNEDENLQRMIDEYLDGDAGSCREDCVHYKSCNE